MACVAACQMTDHLVLGWMSSCVFKFFSYAVLLHLACHRDQEKWPVVTDVGVVTLTLYVGVVNDICGCRQYESQCEWMNDMVGVVNILCVCGHVYMVAVK